MFSFKSIVLIALAFAINTECHEVAVPAVAAAPLTVPAHVGYANVIPQNLPPHASQVSFYNRAIATPFATPFAAPVAAPFSAPVSAPFAAPVGAPFAAPFTAPYAARFAAAPYYTGPGPVAAPYALSAPFAAPSTYAALFPYSGAFLRTPFGVPSAFVR